MRSYFPFLCKLKTSNLFRVPMSWASLGWTWRGYPIQLIIFYTTAHFYIIIRSPLLKLSEGRRGGGTPVYMNMNLPATFLILPRIVMHLSQKPAIYLRTNITKSKNPPNHKPTPFKYCIFEKQLRTSTDTESILVTPFWPLSSLITFNWNGSTTDNYTCFSSFGKVYNFASPMPNGYKTIV